VAQDVKNDKAEVVIAARCDPEDKTQTASSAGDGILTKKQAEVAVEFLRARRTY